VIVEMSAAMGNGAAAAETPLLFVSYSRRDARGAMSLVMLAPEVRERRLEVWSDQREVVGEESRPQVEKARPSCFRMNSVRRRRGVPKSALIGKRGRPPAHAAM
jgi:hypothetical protein